MPLATLNMAFGQNAIEILQPQDLRMVYLVWRGELVLVEIDPLPFRH